MPYPKGKTRIQIQKRVTSQNHMDPMSIFVKKSCDLDFDILQISQHILEIFYSLDLDLGFSFVIKHMERALGRYSESMSPYIVVIQLYLICKCINIVVITYIGVLLSYI